MYSNSSRLTSFKPIGKNAAGQVCHFISQNYVKGHTVPIDDVLTLAHDVVRIKFFEALRLHHLDIAAAETIASESDEHPLIKALKNRKRTHIINQSHMVRESIRVSTQLREANIPIKIYKGVPMNLQFYGGLGKRTTRDIDLAIPYSYFDALPAVMHSLGYQRAKPRKTSRKDRFRYRMLDYPWNKVDANGNVAFNVDIHWKPVHHALWTDLKFDEKRLSEPSVLASIPTLPVFPRTLHAFYVISHHGLVDGWGKLYQLLDLVKILDTIDNSELEVLLSLVKRHRMIRVYNFGTQLCNYLFQMSLEQIDSFKFSEGDVVNYAERILTGELALNWSDNPRKILSFISQRDTLADKIRSVSRLTRYKIGLLCM